MKDNTNWEEEFDRKFPRGLCQAYDGSEGPTYAYGQEILVKAFLRETIEKHEDEGARRAVEYIWERAREVGKVEGDNITFHADQLAGILEVAKKKATNHKE